MAKKTAAIIIVRTGSCCMTQCIPRPQPNESNANQGR